MFRESIPGIEGQAKLFMRALASDVLELHLPAVRKVVLDADVPLGVRSDMELGRQHNVLTAVREERGCGAGLADERCAGWERVGGDGRRQCRAGAAGYIGIIPGALHGLEKRVYVLSDWLTAVAKGGFCWFRCDVKVLAVS
jgi:hypothetical protein